MKTDSEKKEPEFDYERYIIEPKNFEKHLQVGIIKHETSCLGSDVEYFHNSILKMIELEEDDIIIAPEFDYNFSDKVMGEEEKNLYIEEIKEATEGKDILVFPGTFIWYDGEYAHNTAPVISDGEQIAECYKYYDCGSSGAPSKYELKYYCPMDEVNNSKKWAKGKKGGIFKWKENKVGVEICADHYHNLLKHAVWKKNFDLQVIISCGMNLYPKDTVIKKGGYAIICDGSHPPYTKAVRKELDFEYSDIPSESLLIDSEYAIEK